MLTLMNGGTKLTRRFVEKRVKDLSKNGEEDTIDEFLVKNKAVILQNKLGKNKEYVFFPTSGLTNLDYWDLCMFCFILEETCDLSYTTKMRIKKLLKIRNKLCHLNDPTLETIKFDDYTYHLNVSFENCLDEINDEKFTEEMKALVQTLATGPLSIDDTLKAIHKLYHSELTQKEVLEKIGNGQDLTNGKLDTLIEKVERLETRWPSGASEDIPGIGMVIEVGNCSEEKKKEILDTLEKNFNEAILQKVSCPEEDLPNGVLHTLRESVTQVFRDFLIKGRHITFVKQKCLLLTIKCTSVKSFLKLIHDYRTGDLSLQLSGIETAIKNLQGCRNVQLVNLIFKEEFMEVMDDLVSKLYERVQQTEYTSVQTSSNAENSIHVTLKCPTISERETVQNRFKTKMFVDGMKHIETELKRKLNVESMTLTAKLVVTDDAVSNLAQQSDLSVVDENAKVEEESQTKQSSRNAALCKEEDTYTHSLNSGSLLILSGSRHTCFSKRHVEKSRVKETLISFDDNERNMQISTGPTSIPIRTGSLNERMFVAAIDIGTTYSGYAFQTREDFNTDPLKNIITNNWKSSVPGLSHKTPTCILFNKHQQFHSFGNDAEQRYNALAADGETCNWYFFKHFKMSLYKEEALSRDTVIRDDKGMNMPAMIVFKESLKYLKDHLIKRLEEDCIDIRPQYIHWVITVPAIWTDSAKQFMREAAINAEIHTDMVSLCLEPEVASLFCRYLRVQRVTGASQAEIRSFSIGDKYMILDCGGGTVDITVHEIQEDSTLRELAKANGGECGGTKVDEKFISLLNDLFGPDVMEVICQRFREDYLDVMQSFEIKKRRISPDLSGTETIKIPVSFTATYEELNNINIANNPSIPQRLKGKVSFTNDKVRVDADVIKNLFTDACAEICQKAKEFFSSIREHRIDKILMVGGFSESEMLQVKVRETFPRLTLMIPEEAGLAVLKGAVLFGHNPKMITARVMKYSYGIRAFKHFEPGLDPPEKREVQGDFVLCKDYFSKHATIGKEYKTEEKVYTQEYYPSEVSGSQLEVWVYTSPRKHPLYIDEEGSRRIGEIIISLRNTKGKDNPFKIQFEFGNTELMVKVKDTVTGHVKDAHFDLLTL